jgi:hypothetical protein
LKIFLGNFNEQEVEEIAKDLSKINVGFEVKNFVNCEGSSAYFLKGSLNELKEKYKNTELMPLISEWENYLNIAREIMKTENRVREFEEAFLNKIFPNRSTVIEKVSNLMKDKVAVEDNKIDFLEFDEILDEKLEENPEILEPLLEIAKTDEFSLIINLHKILEMNGIKYENIGGTEIMVGELPQDPKVNIEIDWLQAKKYKINKNVFISIEELYSLYVELIDCIYASKEISEIAVKHPVLYEIIPVLEVCNNLFHLIESGENDLEKIINSLKNLIKEEKDTIFIKSYENFLRDMIEYLDKNKIIKVKGNKVKIL